MGHNANGAARDLAAKESAGARREIARFRAELRGYGILRAVSTRDVCRVHQMKEKQQ